MLLDNTKTRPLVLDLSKQECDNFSELAKPEYFNVLVEKDQHSSGSKKKISKKDNSDLELLLFKDTTKKQLSGSFTMRSPAKAMKHSHLSLPNSKESRL
jgi:hypothetical protein